MDNLKASKLTILPVEILWHIASYLYRPSQLNNLSKTCKKLNSVIQTRLYRDVSIVLPDYWKSAMFLEHLLEYGAGNLQHTRSLTISIPNHRVRADHKDKFCFDPDGDLGETGNGRLYYQPRVLNALMRLVICRVPDNQLEAFCWYHTTRISETTVALVARRHGRSLKTLRIYNNTKRMSNFEPHFSALSLLDAGDINSFDSELWASRLVAHNVQSLRHITLGYEKPIALSYLGMQPAIGSSEASDFTKRLWHNILATKARDSRSRATAEPWMLVINSLHFIGIECRLGPQIGAFSMAILDRLTSLCLESCFNLGQSFDALTSRRSANAPPILPRLRSFRLRQEGVDALFQASLMEFFFASRGIVHLAVLLDGCAVFLNPDCVTINHGLSLRTLVWDERQRPRRNLNECTNMASTLQMSRSLDSICQHCPNLRELGLAMDVFGGENYPPYGHLIPLLKNLKTLNIRNLPIQDAGSQTLTLLRVHEGVAIDVAKTLFRRGLRLEVFGLGSITWGGSRQLRPREPHSERCQSYLCPRIHYIDYPMNIRGERQPLVTQIAQGTADEAKEYSSDLRIFEPYWLV